MTTDELTGLEPHLSAEAQDQLDELRRLILGCQRHTDQANLLVRQSSYLVEASLTCMSSSAASMVRHGAVDFARRSG